MPRHHTGSKWRPPTEEPALERFFGRSLTTAITGAMAILHEKRAWLRVVAGRTASVHGGCSPLLLRASSSLARNRKLNSCTLLFLFASWSYWGGSALTIFRFTQTVAGVAAAAASQWEAAEDHFQTASRQAESVPTVSNKPRYAASAQ
jgi:hypothetical protein